MALPASEIDEDPKSTGSERRNFIRLTPEERRRRLAIQAEQIAPHYEESSERAMREVWQGGDIVEP